MSAQPSTPVTLLRGGTVVDPVDGEYRADVLLSGDRIAALGDSATSAPDAEVVDADGLLILPGGIDVHSHADARVFDDDVQLALLRSGVTSVVAGQDGVSFAPGDGTYARDYFGPLNGDHPSYRGGGVAALLKGYDQTTRINVGYLVPAGTVRYEVMGRDPRPATPTQLSAMVALVRAGLADGALGLSTGLDYVPGCFADAAELAALCEPVAAVGGVYVTHMRGYEESTPTGIAEVVEICRRSGAAGHISHFHARSDLVAQSLETARAEGVDLTWDAYPYFRSFTLLSMVLLPKDLIREGNAAAAAQLRDPERRAALVQALGRSGEETIGPRWAERMRIALAGSQAYAFVEGQTIADAAAARGEDPLDLALRMLAESELATTTVVEIPSMRDDEHLARQYALPGATCGSDGIFLGGAPHPRAYGCFARLLSQFVRVRQDLSWQDAAAITSGTAAARFGLPRHGRVASGAIADLALVDPATIADRADYDVPTRLSTGIERVFVRGSLVLDGGELTPALAGRPLLPEHAA
ncbi:N-acyl-D-amino-acid deacylase family protein [Actinopolymorpha pittospori]|uniref:N-acyl-D-amino-acid deacylase n=1 Tax=Actinopolymorpha pittospori TaxID=648752 RepID=A0A927MQQ6_9ACTN|nr:amidohydrolase family protein [Actinopolymorpha pittospori]MBE1604601.1 N-acyl-D-amino-acid deacylase [Actinopolymorpha pittospori]